MDWSVRAQAAEFVPAFRAVFGCVCPSRSRWGRSHSIPVRLRRENALLDSATARQQLRQYCSDAPESRRLPQDHVGPDGLNRKVVVTCEHHHQRGRRASLLELAQQGPAAQPRHVRIKDRQRRLHLVDQRRRAYSVARKVYVIARRLEVRLQDVGHLRVVLGHNNPRPDDRLDLGRVGG